MNYEFMNRRGVLTVWIAVLAGIFIVGLLYVIFSQVLYGNITPTFYEQLNAINETTSGVNVTMMHNTINLINMIWYVFPLLFIFGLILWGFIASQKTEYDTSYYGI